MRPLLLGALVACAPAPSAPVAAVPSAVTGTTTVLLVVSGLAAADIAPCGGPTPMPQLAALAQAPDAHLSCQAVSASPRSLVALKSVLDGRAPLQPDAGTRRRPLAREAAASGMRTVLVSADPRTLPLAKEFQLSETSRDPQALRGRGLAEALAPLLLQVEPDRDLLVVAVISDATAPFPPVAARPGVPAQDWLHLHTPDGEPTPLVARWRNGTLAIDEEDRHVRRLATGVQAGRAAADDHVAAVLSAVEAARGPVARLVLTSDAAFGATHKDALGDQELPLDTAVRVPFLVRGGLVPPEQPFPNTLAWEAALGLGVPSPLPPAVSGVRGTTEGTGAVDLWLADGSKAAWRDGAVGRVLPDADPLEQALGPLDEADAARLRVVLAALRTPADTP